MSVNLMFFCLFLQQQVKRVKENSITKMSFIWTLKYKYLVQRLAWQLILEIIYLVIQIQKHYAQFSKNKNRS